MNNISHQSYESGLVSIIIPAFNSGKYIRRMLDSIYAQTYHSLEIIVAYDEKSSDDTIDILRDYEIKYHLTIDIGNDSSVGVARNRGLLLARGEYVIFLDADDLIIPSYIENMVNVFHKYPHLDLVYSNYISLAEPLVNSRYAILVRDSSKSCFIYTKKNVINGWMEWEIPRYVWCWLIKRRYLSQYNIFYPNCSHGEDQVFTFQLVLNADMVGVINSTGYIYIYHSESLDHKHKSPISRWENDACMRRIFSNMLSDNYPGYEKEIINRLTLDFVRMIRVLPFVEFKGVLECYNIEKILPIIISKHISLTMTQCCFNVSICIYYIIFASLRFIGSIFKKQS